DTLGKSLNVEIAVGGVQLERDVLDQLWESLLHLVRNAVDHGLEAESERNGKPKAGKLTLAAQSNGPLVLFRVEDDGRGVDMNRVREAAIARGLIDAASAYLISEVALTELLFEHGFSTCAGVGELSGRGVGLDVVRRRVESLGGNVVLESSQG